jgi:hypothetical protein
MNNLNQLEKQLESWIPRRPSAKIRRQLFAPPTPDKAQHHPPLAALWLSLGAVACILMVAGWLALPRQARNSAFTASASSNLIASLTLTDAMPAARNLIASFSSRDGGLENSCQQNLWSAVTFDWTKAGSSPSMIGPSGLGRTNL